MSETEYYIQNVADSPLQCSPDEKTTQIQLVIHLSWTVNTAKCKLQRGLVVASSGIKQCNIPSGTIQVYVTVIFNSALLNRKKPILFLKYSNENED